MTLSFEIDENKLYNAVLNELIRETIDEAEKQLFTDDGWSRMRKMYKEDVHKCMMNIIKDHEDEIIDKAISEAGAIIARKAGAIVMGGVTFGKTD